LIVG